MSDRATDDSPIAQLTRERDSEKARADAAEARVKELQQDAAISGILATNEAAEEIERLTADRDAWKARAMDLEAHERSTHQVLGAILGTDDSLERLALRLRTRAAEAEGARDAWKARAKAAEAKMAPYEANSRRIAEGMSPLGREIVAGLNDFADHLERGGKAEDYVAPSELDPVQSDDGEPIDTATIEWLKSVARGDSPPSKPPDHIGDANKMATPEAEDVRNLINNLRGAAAQITETHGCLFCKGRMECAAALIESQARRIEAVNELARQLDGANQDRDQLAATLAARDARIEELEKSLVVMGERALVDFDDAGVGIVDQHGIKAEKYVDWLRVVMNSAKSIAERDAEIERLKAELAARDDRRSPYNAYIPPDSLDYSDDDE